MKAWLAFLFSLLLGGCATGPATNAVALFNDALFRPPSERIDSADVFAVSEPMRRFLHDEAAAPLHLHGRQLGLYKALHDKRDLFLEYDSSVTRNAAETFDARAGNCLSLVLMTAALAREIGLPVQFNHVVSDEIWSRSGDLYFFSGHVNISLGKRHGLAETQYDRSQFVTIDFLPIEETFAQKATVIGERTVIAMYMSNRAAETLAAGRVDDAYWWVREALRQDPGFTSAYNTLGVIYRRHGNLLEAERVLREALRRDRSNTLVMYNLLQTVAAQGRSAEALALKQELDRLEPYPPFHFYQLGMAAMQRGDYRAAQQLFAREAERAPANHELHFQMAIAAYRLGESAQAERELALAHDNSTTRHDRDVYAAKLARLRALQVQ